MEHTHFHYGRWPHLFCGVTDNRGMCHYFVSVKGQHDCISYRKVQAKESVPFDTEFWKNGAVTAFSWLVLGKEA